MKPIRQIAFILTIGMTTLLWGQSDVQTQDSNAARISPAELTAKLKQCVFAITVPDRSATTPNLGTGFAIAKNLIATNLHVVGLGRPITVKAADGRELAVTDVHASDRDLDLAILKLDVGDTPLTPLSLGDSNAVADGTPAMAIGNPLGWKFSVVSGNVSARRDIDMRPMLQLSMPIEPGNSGGPVFDMQGNVLGIVTMKSVVTRNLAFAVEIDSLKPLIEKPNSVPMDRWLTLGKLDSEIWTELMGAQWRQRGGRISVEGAGSQFGGRSLCLRNARVPEVPYEIAVSVKMQDESGAAGLIFDADGADRHYGFYPSSGNMRLSRFDGPTVFSWNVLYNQPSEHYRSGDWNHIRVRVENDRVLCFVNGHLVVESTDRKLPMGKVGLAKFRHTKAEFKGFQIGKTLEFPQLSQEQESSLKQLINQLPSLNTLVSSDLGSLTKTPASSHQLLLHRAKELESRAKQLRAVADDVQTRAICLQLSKLTQAPQNQESSEFDLLRAGLLIAQLDGEDIDVDAYIRQVDNMALTIRRQLPSKSTPEQRLQALNTYLFQQNGFHGSRFDYYHRANSYLNRVIDDRVGLPITLSILYMELGKRLELQIESVALPGHFVVKFINGQQEQLIDVFGDAKVLSFEDAKKMVQNALAGPASDQRLSELTKQYMQTANQMSVLVRLINNLRNLAERDQDHGRLLRYLEALVTLDPASPEFRGMRAVVRFQSKRYDAAIEDLDWFFETKPKGIDLEQIHRMRTQFQNQRP